MTVDQSFREKLELGELLKCPNASGKAAFRKSFVCIDICGHDCQMPIDAYNKSIPLRSVCACVCVCVAETTRIRELKVILLLVLGWHECFRGKFYIKSILTLIN